MTSDAFFSERELAWVFNQLPVGFAFIDGMHLFEYALRDFVNVERLAHPGSLIVMHDCLPASEEMTSREYLPSLQRWTGDGWKVLYYLIEERPDLRMSVLDAPPKGLTVIQPIDPKRDRPDGEIDSIIDRYKALTYDDFLSLRVSLAPVPLTGSALDGVFPPTPFGTLTTEVRIRRVGLGFRRSVMASALGPRLRTIRRPTRR